MAYDVTICDPTADTYLQLGSNRQPLRAAAEATRKKNSRHDAEVAKAGPQGLPTPFEFQPLAFETTGAMGSETEEVVEVGSGHGGRAQGCWTALESPGPRPRAHLGCQFVLLVLETMHSNDTRESSGRGDRVMHQAKLWLSS